MIGDPETAGGVGACQVDDLPRPTPGDHLTFYTYDQASPWLRMAPVTIRRHVRTGAIPREFITKLPGRKGRVYLTGDQIVRLLAYFASDRTPPAPVGRPYGGRRRTAAA